MPTIPAMPVPVPVPEVRFVFAAPSPYTGRFDATRAGLGIALELHRVAREQLLPVRISLVALPYEVESAEAKALFEPGPRVLVVGGSTWSQGSAAPLRRLFELGGGASLQGVRATAFATAGGAHTGGEMVVLDSLRSLMGQGALAFTSGQRLMVFSTDERLDHPPGQFTPLDCWAMGQYARELLLQAYASSDPVETKALASRLGVDLAYFRRFPRALSSLDPESISVCARINPLAAPARPGLAAVASDLGKPVPVIRALFRP
jgi:hypothetical protein